MIVFGVAVIFVTIGLVIVTIAKRRNNMDDNQEDHDFDRLEMTSKKRQMPQHDLKWPLVSVRYKLTMKQKQMSIKLNCLWSKVKLKMKKMNKLEQNLVKTFES